MKRDLNDSIASGRTLDDIINEAETTQERSEPELTSSSEDVLKKWDARRRAEADGTAHGLIASKFPACSLALGGGYRPGLHAVAGGEGMGKSTFCEQEVWHAVTRKKPVPSAILSLELDDADVAHRIMMRELGWEYSRSGADAYGRTEGERIAASEMRARWAAAPLHVLDILETDLSTRTVMESCERLYEMSDGTLRLLVVDYFNEIEHETRPGESKADAAARTARLLSTWSKARRVATLLPCQFNKVGNKSPEPTRHDIADTSGVSRAAVSALMLWPEAKGPRVAVKPRTAFYDKARGGRRGRIDFGWEHLAGRFVVEDSPFGW